MVRLSLMKKLEALEHVAAFRLLDSERIPFMREVDAAIRNDPELIEIRAIIGERKPDEGLADWLHSPEKREAAKRIAPRLAALVPAREVERESADG